ncbi:MAG: hypothetical protein ACKVOY_05795 [Burkholderiaceae bacterium]
MMNLNVTKVVNGKKVVPKKPKITPLSKAHFVRQRISQLNVALVRDSRVLTKLDERSEFNIALRERIEKFISNIVFTIDSFPENGQRIPAAFFKKVQLLKPIQEQFVNECQQDLSASDKNSKRIALATKWLADDVHYFVVEIERTYSSLEAILNSTTGELLPPSPKNIPNRHRDPEKERIFIQAIKKYADEKGRKDFMPYRFVLPFMKQVGLTFSDRTYRTFKKDYIAGNFGKLVR